ncbi:MAG TPA: hypothetical protein PLB55_05355, partial [Prosthecobacter sp.]|nr:hypothetical protein [Prosthecobacter sp.]
RRPVMPSVFASLCNFILCLAAGWLRLHLGRLLPGQGSRWTLEHEWNADDSNGGDGYQGFG